MTLSAVTYLRQQVVTNDRLNEWILIHLTDSFKMLIHLQTKQVAEFRTASYYDLYYIFL